MSKLNSLEIENVKGISNKSFNLNFFPNKPCILVAPNGFGKSSIACAFKSLKSNKLELKDDDFHTGIATLKPRLKIEVDSVYYEADSTKNELYSNFDYFVINSPIVAKAKKTNFGSFTTATASLSVDTIELVSTIPDKVEFKYSLSENKTWFGCNGKVLNSIERTILKDLEFVYFLSKKIDFSLFNKKTSFINPVNNIIVEINNINGTQQELKEQIADSILPKMILIQDLKNLAELIKTCSSKDEVDSYLDAIQLARVVQDSSFSKALSYAIYCRDRIFFDKLISAVNSTRHSLKAKEVKKTKAKNSKKKLIVEFPKVSSISNGQRDIISFVSQIQKAKNRFKKKLCILIIDEIFDYLDDANLVSFQYYITKLIEEFKEQGRTLYPVLLTHLDPNYFNHFCFNKHKMQINYLARDPSKVSSDYLCLVKNRDDDVIKDDLSKYFFHYHPDNKDLESDFLRLGIKKAWCQSKEFYNNIHDEVKNYLQGIKYDPIAVLFGLRIKIEESAYNQLPTCDRPEFITTHKTKRKLEFCAEKGINIDEINYLLGLIYNDDLHWRPNRDYITPLVSKLENITIKQMIRELY
ncbi:ATP-binding cassette domain-containing protein [Vibrio diazotrophicus]|uniref:AAA domain-containing protein n=1 Tax=Vibrio diazotrophicus TaxID=685 RepID=A0ABX4WE29_VIBDI|nr:ABC transporter ATP-binding protein [Vibrio diazotrophicus]PNI02352.1 hypothetical protein C1O25_04175 [Vibrio diazotrophicus]